MNLASRFESLNNKLWNSNFFAKFKTDYKNNYLNTKTRDTTNKNIGKSYNCIPHKFMLLIILKSESREILKSEYNSPLTKTQED